MIADHRATMVSVNERIVSLESQLNAAKVLSFIDNCQVL